MSLLEFLAKLIRFNPSGAFSPSMEKTIESAIKGMIVANSHSTNKRRYIVQGIGKSANEEILNETSQTVSEYFKSTYNLNLRYMNLLTTKMSR